MKFKQLAEYFEKLGKVSGRLEMTRILAELFGEAEAEEVKEICYMSLGQLGPSYDRIEVGMAEKMMLRVMSRAYELEEEQVRKTYKELGDVGLTAHAINAKFRRKGKELSVLEVYGRLLEVAQEAGSGSQEKKVQGLADLLRDLDALSAKFVARMPVGKLRLGFSDMTMLDGLSWMVTGDKSLHDELEEAYNVAADVGLIAEKVKEILRQPEMSHHFRHAQDDKTDLKSLSVLSSEVAKALKHVQVKLGTPVIPALCQRLKSFDEIMNKMSEVAVEPKYDGTRLQIHWKREGNWLRTFTRNLEENSEMFPELEKLGDYVKGESFIFDCEAIGVDLETGKSLPFQVTMSRKRKHEIEAQTAKVPMRFIVFDVLYAQGKGPSFAKAMEGGDIHHLALAERRKILEEVILPGKPIEVIKQTVTTEAAECRQLHHKYLGEGLEGVIIKKWNSDYVPGRKGWNWVKMKEVETAKAGLSDTLDCVVMGYYRGRGKRANFGLGAFLVGVKDQGFETREQKDRKTEKQKNSSELETGFVTVSKIGTGLSDEQFRELLVRLKKLEVKEKPEEYAVDKFLYPDVWVKPEIVVEIAADNITKSPNHTAGLALRFPRLVKFRDDKGAEQASTIEEVNRLYEIQK